MKTRSTFQNLMRRAAMMLLLAVLTAWPVGSYAQTFYDSNDGNWSYEILDDNDVMLHRYQGSATTITTPTTIYHIYHLKYYSVTRIDDQCFSSNNTATSIVISEGVEYIGERAFASCTNLESVSLPTSLTTLGKEAFSSCTKLLSITLPSQVTAIGDGTFASCSSLASVTFNGNVTSISAEAFKLCESLTAITLPGTVSSIGNGAFYGCDKLTSITLPSGVTAIGQETFKKCEKLASVILEGNVVTIGQEAFSECHNLSDFTLPNSVNTIEDRAFYNCGSLSSITIPNEVSIIGQSTFNGCISLANVTINGNVTTIEDQAFYQCPIAQIMLPYSVVTIDTYAFGGSKLKHLYYAGPKSRWENMVYKGENALPYFTNVHWQCTATFDMQGHGTAPAAQTVYSGVASALTAPASDPTAQGWDFSGWYADAACTEAFDFMAALSDDTTIYAKWMPRTDNVVTFDTGGKGSAIASQTVTTGGVVSVPAMQYYMEEGTTYGIEGWYTDAGCTDAYDFSTAVDHSFTLYAKWVEATCSATISANEGGTVTLTDELGRVIDSDKIFPGRYTLTVTPESGNSFTGSYTRTKRSDGISEMAHTFGGTTAYTTQIDLTAYDVAINVTFGAITTHKVFVNVNTDEGVTLGTFTLCDGAEHSYTGDGTETLAKVYNESEAFWNTSYDLTLTITKGESGCAATVVNNDVTTYIDNSTATYTFTPTGNVTINLYFFKMDAVDVTLADDNSNSSTLATLNNNGEPQPHTVQLKGRRLWKNGYWNTLCLPFALKSLTGTPLEGATVMRLNTTSKSSGKYRTRFDEGDKTLNLYFSSVSSIDAGQPYIVKWEGTNDYIENPVFNGVFITATEPGYAESKDGKVSFTGTFNPVTFEAGNKDRLCVDDGDKLKWAGAGFTLNSFRAYFMLDGIDLSAVANNVGLKFEGEATGILNVNDNETLRYENDNYWYTLDGRRLSEKPTAKGVYIHNGIKVVIK